MRVIETVPRAGDKGPQPSHVGRQVSGVDITADLAPAVVAELLRLLAERSLLLFRDRCMGPLQ
jgi:alpha-ketoglutarate-dependent taurine dioxygenase